jgi:hypothetical protein
VADRVDDATDPVSACSKTTSMLGTMSYVVSGKSGWRWMEMPLTGNRVLPPCPDKSPESGDQFTCPGPCGTVAGDIPMYKYLFGADDASYALAIPRRSLRAYSSTSTYTSTSTHASTSTHMSASTFMSPSSSGVLRYYLRAALPTGITLAHNITSSRKHNNIQQQIER